MNLVFVTEARFIIDNNGKLYGLSAFGKKHWDRYLSVFSKIIVVARVLRCENYNGDLELVTTDECLTFFEIPHFVGPFDYFKSYKSVLQSIDLLLTENSDAKFLCRIPGTLGSLVIKRLKKHKIHYAVEVVGDPWDVFAPGGISHILRIAIRLKTTYDLKKNVGNAFSVLYVTNETLQKRYPARQAGFVINASNVYLEKSSFAESPKSFHRKDNYGLISIGSLDQMYKSPDLVLRAIKYLHDRGIKCKLIWLGGGKYLDSMIKMACELGISEFVDFKGNVDRNVLRTELFQSDLFILASRTEGLPRSVIEAMAAGLPCIGTNVGGIPELLDNLALVQKNDSESLALKIEEFLKNSSLYNLQAARNLEEAQNYKEEILAQRRNMFYKFILENQ